MANPCGACNGWQNRAGRDPSALAESVACVPGDPSKQYKEGMVVMCELDESINYGTSHRQVWWMYI